MGDGHALARRRKHRSVTSHAELSPRTLRKLRSSPATQGHVIVGNGLVSRSMILSGCRAWRSPAPGPVVEKHDPATPVVALETVGRHNLLLDGRWVLGPASMYRRNGRPPTGRTGGRNTCAVMLFTDMRARTSEERSMLVEIFIVGDGLPGPERT